MRSFLTCMTLLTSLTLVVMGSAARTVRAESAEDEGQEDPGCPLYLTPLIDSGNLEKARHQSAVKAGWAEGLSSYAGYITVNATFNSNLFFWLFETQATCADAPLLLWLNGGPGNPSTLGALLENGPLEITEDTAGHPQVTRRKRGDWTTRFHMLYVDSPVGTGYSYTADPAGQPHTMQEIVSGLYSVLIQVYTLFPQYQGVELYIGGQSYAGKYIPALGKLIHDRNQEAAAIRLPLQGIYIGGGLCDPETMFPEFVESLYYTGLISNKTRQEHGAAVRAMIHRSLDRGFVTLKDLHGYFGDGLNISEEFNFDNMLGVKETIQPLDGAMTSFMNSSVTKCHLHVGPVKRSGFRSFNGTVFEAVTRRDMFVNTREENAFLMDNYKVLHFTGNLDMTVSVAMTEAFLNVVPWSGQQQYRQHVRHRWWGHLHHHHHHHNNHNNHSNHMLGWFNKIGNFTRVIVRNAGHQVPYNQPEAALLMMINFVSDLDFKGDP